MTDLQQRLVKTGGRLIKQARYDWLLLAEGHLTRRLASVLGPDGRIAASVGIAEAAGRHEINYDIPQEWRGV